MINPLVSMGLLPTQDIGQTMRQNMVARGTERFNQLDPQVKELSNTMAQRSEKFPELMAQYAEKRKAVENFDPIALYGRFSDYETTRASLLKETSSDPNQKEITKLKVEQFDAKHAEHLANKKDLETLGNTVAVLNQSLRDDTVRLNALSKSRDEALRMISA